jgi:hypothetical protein
METVLAAIITLIGTLAAVAIGFRQWRRTQSVSERKDYREKRVETLRILWEAVNKIEEQHRTRLTEFDNIQNQQEQTREINLLLMKSAPFLFNDEREWSISIVQSIIEIDAIVRVQKWDGELPAEWWETTMMPPPTALEAARAAHRLDIARDALASRYAAVMRGEHD